MSKGPQPPPRRTEPSSPQAEPAAAPPTVFIVEDDPSMGDSLHWLLESRGLAAEVHPTAAAFLQACDPDRPGCLLLDVRLPGMSGLALLAELAERGITLPVIVMTGFADVPTAVRAMKAGAIAFIEKPFDDEALVAQVEQALAVDREARPTQAERARVLARLARLTPRERQVMERVVKGQPNKLIAAGLGISQRTVEVHRAHIMRKMEVPTVARLVRMLWTHTREADRKQE